jgi:hypothetical protein
VVPADVLDRHADVAEVEVDPFGEDDVGLGDLDDSRSRQFLTDGVGDVGLVGPVDQVNSSSLRAVRACAITSPLISTPPKT